MNLGATIEILNFVQKRKHAKQVITVPTTILLLFVFPSTLKIYNENVYF